MATIQLRSAGVEDSGSVTSLLSSVNEWPGFDHAGTMGDYWTWKYIHNPLGTGNEIIAESQGRVVSHAASIPTNVTIKQKVRRCAQLSDLYTDPKNRGQGLMESATSALFAADAMAGIEMELAFPSPTGYELTLKAGFTELPVRFGHYELIANPSRFFQNVKYGTFKRMAFEGMRMMKGRKDINDGTVEVRSSLTFPPDIQALTDAFEKKFDFIFHRDEDYLRWRYEHPESGAFKILISTIDGRTSGYAILRPYVVSGHRYIDVIDLVCDPQDVPSLRGLIEKCVQVCAKEEAATLQIWLPIDHPFLPELGRRGFFQRQPMAGERRMRLMARTFVNDASLENIDTNSLRYHLVLGDTDWV